MTNQQRRYWKRIGGWALLGIIVFSCAKPLSPTGGPRDEVPPEVVRSSPASGTLNYEGDEVRFWFNEPIRKPTYDKEIFVSPFIRRPKIVLADSYKRFKIKFEEDLRPNTTYVITLTEIKDNSESNPIEKAYTLAFSTGDVLDSMELKGKIQSPRLGKGVKDMTVMLFDVDSAINNDFMGQRPAYLTKADEEGRFSLQYLRNAPFRILAIKDADQSNSYSVPNELVAIASDTLIVFPDDSTNLATVRLHAFFPNAISPRIQDYDWLNDSTLACRFSENLRLDTLSLILTDTLNQDSVELTDFSWYRHKDPELLIHMTRPQALYSNLHFQGISDSLWNVSDSILRIDPSREREQFEPLLETPKLLMAAQAWEFLTMRKLNLEDSSLIVLTDTARTDSNRKQIPYSMEIDAFRVRIQPQPLPDSAMPFVLRVNGQLRQPEDSIIKDSTFNLTWFDPEEFGEIKGAVKLDSTWQLPIILRLMSGESVVETVFDTSFHFTLLKPGDYGFHIVQDVDSNQVWSPGQIFPPRLPEKIYEHGETISIKANWEFEEHTIEMQLKPPPPIIAPDTSSTSIGAGEPPLEGPGGPGRIGEEKPEERNR
ncbi:MAG: Ig-like domain-containing protein [Bacteroidota bacterium]